MRVSVGTGARVLTAALFVGSLAACYKYVPVHANPAPHELRQGTAVRVQLSEPGQFKLTELIADNVFVVDGELVRVDQDALVLSAFWLRTGTGYEHKGIGETVIIPLETIAALERKAVSFWKTAGLAGGWVALSVLGIVALTSGGEGSPGGGPPPPPQ